MIIMKSVHQWLQISVIVLALVGSSLQRETAQECGRTKCKVEDQPNFKYNVGTVYRYHHNVNVSLNLGNASTASNLFISSQVDIEFITPCEADLRITEARISERLQSPDEAKYLDRAGTKFKEHLEKHSLRFAFEDGLIQDLCPHPNENIWTLNIKRGILSMLQNTMERFDVDHHGNELDVNGICDTRYRLHEARKTSLIITKTKDLDNCSNRGKHLSIIQSSGYTSPRKHSSNNLLDSTLNCEIVIDHNIYESVSCRETHTVLPLSNRDAAVKTTINSKLALIEEATKDEAFSTDYDNDEDEKITYSSIVPTNLLYDHSSEVPAGKTNIGELRISRDLLKTMCILGSSGQLEQQFSDIFTKFIHSARFLDHHSLSQLLHRADGICSGGKKHILDALPFIGTGASIKVMRDKMSKKMIDRDRSDKWLMAIALVPRPEASTVAALLPILELERDMPDAKLSLVYSSVVRAFCRNDAAMNKLKHREEFFRSEDCLSIEGTGINKFVARLEETIEKGCAPRAHKYEDNQKTLEALKAIGNMGLETKGMLVKLAQCVKDEGGFLPMELKIAAIEAYRRLPSCPETRDEIFLDLYQNVTFDSEIRIAAYLQVMRCPDYTVIKTIKRILRDEPVNQVGSFVWSHLTNLLASSSPTRIEIQSLLTDRDLSDKFNSDGRKYSRNYETSFFSEEYNVGGTFQSNVVFSSKSYIPRTLTFNISLDLFGESVHVFEATIRFEGMEYYAEKFFGPNGPLANEKISQHITNFLRKIRSPADVNGIWESVRSLPNVIDNNFEDPRVSISYRIFGNELDFMTLRGNEEISKAVFTLDPWQKILKLFSGRELRYDNAAMFLDSSFVVPSTAGLPVRLDLTGSAAGNFKISGLLDAGQSKKTEFQFAGNLAPSVSVDMTGKMTVDAFHKSAGIKLRSNIYSSSAVRLKLDVKGMELIRLNVGLPNRKLEVFSMKTDIVLVSESGGESEETPATGSLRHRPIYFANTTCSWPALERLIGLKLCLDYQFPNTTEITDASYFLLNGPTLFRTFVIKADPTAESYLFEYKWNRSPTESIVKVAFDTPGSKFHREASATLSFDAPTRNVSLLLSSAGNNLIAKGTYKRTDDEAMIDVGLDINGTKHLQGYVGYIRKKGNYGYTYNPKMYLAINGERVAELQGTIRDAHKNNVSQCDIDLTFETKKVKSRIMGYIMSRETSITGNVKLQYQLQPTMKNETLQVEVSLANRSTKTLTHKEANLKIQSSAYPQLNAIINSWYQQALGHLELHLEINGKPHLRDDRHKLTAQLVLTHSKAYFQSDEAKINAYFALTKPIQHLDIKVGIQRFSLGPASKTFILVRYAPGKEITLAVNLIMPRGSMFAIEGHVNMTIPSLESLIVDVKITEKAKREYDIDFAGTWFSGHNVTMRGTYADRSAGLQGTQNFGTPRIVSHNLKLLVRSPSLDRDILVNCKLYRDLTDFKLDVNVEYLDADKYAIKFEHSEVHLGKFTTFAEARYKNNVYAITANFDVEREIRMEIHLDRWRDIHIVLTGINERKKTDLLEKTNKEFGIEIRWDANRDPELKFASLLQLTKHYEKTEVSDSRDLAGYVMVTYPGRLFTCSGLVATKNGNNYVVDGRVSWGPDDNIQLGIDIDFDPENWRNSAKFDGRMLTPFEGWKKTSLNAKYNWTAIQLEMNCDAHWQDGEKFLVHLLASAEEFEDGADEYKANCGLVSTIHNVGWITTNVTHKIYGAERTSNMDTLVLVKYSPDKVVDVKSSWSVERPGRVGDNLTLTGSVQFASPLVNYNNGDFKCQLRWEPNWKFGGASSVEIDLRKYSGTLRGNLAKLRESMIEFNVTTPLEKYRSVTGRFGLSERDRHIVAEVVSPSGPLGVEALCQLFMNNNNEFDVMLKISSPIEVFQRLLVTAKMAKTEADFRLGYNNITAGFQAIWHYNNLTDFHYSYILYTPIHGLHESGVVAKLIIPNMNNKSPKKYAIDTEFSVRVVETKVGIKALSGPKYTARALELLTESEAEVDHNDDFGWHGDAELNLAIVETITATLDVDKDGNVYQTSGIMRIPHGNIVLNDKFTIEDFFDMKNILEVTTPFTWNRINYMYVFNVDMENSIYFMDTQVQIYKTIASNTSYLMETGIRGNYSYSEGEEDDSQNHRFEVIIKTPLDFMKKIDAVGVYEHDENIYKSSIELKTNQSAAKFSGSLELEENFVDGGFTVGVDSPILTIPSTRVTIKKDFTDKQKRIEAGMEMKELKELPCKVQIVWDIESMEEAAVSVLLETWVESLPSAELEISYSNKLARNDSLDIHGRVKNQLQQEYKVATSYQPSGKVQTNLTGPDDMEYKFDGSLDETNRLKGVLIDVKRSTGYDVDGEWNIQKNEKGIVNMGSTVSVIDQKTQQKMEVGLQVLREKYGFKVIVKNARANGTASLNYINSLNWNVNLKSSLQEDVNYSLEAFTNVQANGNTSLYLHAESPLPGLESLETFGNLLLSSDSGDAKIRHRLNGNFYQLNCAWKLTYMIDMLFRINGAANTRSAGLEVFLTNPHKAFTLVNTGFDIQVDKDRWRCGTNATIGYRDSEHFDGVVTVRLPPPDNDDHQILVSYHANRGLQDAKYVIGYTADKAQTNYVTDGSILFSERNIDAHLRLSWSPAEGHTINNIFNATFEGTKIGLKYSLYTPKFLKEETGIIDLRYDGGESQRSILDADVYYPSVNKVGTAHISYDSLINVNGTLNATTSFPKFPYAACDFIVLTTLRRTRRFAKFSWPNDSAYINSDYTYHSERLNSNLEGIVHLEVPLSSRHIADLNYGYKKRPQVTIGEAQLNYNNDKVLDAKYNSKGESRAGFEKETIQITLENPFQPLGIDYVNQFEYSGGNAGTNYPTVESRNAHIYRLDNSSAFSLSGESRIRTTHEGQDIELTAKNFDKTVKLRTDYQVLPGEFNHNCRLDLAEGAWATYRLNIINKTTEEMDNQFVVIDLTYPYRNFTMDGSYKITNKEFNTDGKLSWNRTYPVGEEPFEYETERTIGASLDWKNLTENIEGASDRQLLNFTLKHPSLTKDATLAGYLHRREGKVLLNATVIVDYSEDPNKFGWLSTVVQDDAVSPREMKYSYSIKGQHPKTKLNLNMMGSVTRNFWSFFHTFHNASYSRKFVPEERAQLHLRIDLPKRQLEFHRESNDVTKHLDLAYYPAHPVYSINGSIIDSSNSVNATGAYYLDIPEKLTWMMVNYTPDAVTSLRMYGNIPDVRNAMFNIWRTYDRDLVVNDVSFYLKLNHSRLVTYTLKWRPELKQDITDTLRSAVTDLYTEFGKDMDYWKHYVKSESMRAVNEIWDDAKDDLRIYIEDWENLRELDYDLERLKTYLNESYNANEFYVKDVVAVGLYVIDELALKKHIESLPNIFNEIWEIMGESGEAIRKSLLWIIEATKAAYKKLTEIASAIIKGESISQIAQIIEKIVEKYDKFMKDLHVSFIKYMENLWTKFSLAINQQWDRILKAIEPLFIRVLHYLEAVLWKASKEILDFLYDRRNEIIKSPYFDRLANFTQDVDKLYRDIKANDIITNIRKYSAIIISFLKERYFTMVPFGKELKAIVDEILSEFSELKKLPSVHFALEKFHYIYERLNYFYKYFGIQAKLEKTIRVVHSKLMDVSQSALQAESKYRQAKTKFIFDPNIGLMCLEQKLPVSWHAFNQTPEFQEIPEYRAIIDLRNYFTTSNATFWTLYYHYKPYTDPYNWLPPFKAQAMIVGSQHYVTFDGHHYDFSGTGSYLLASDFVSSDFAVVISYSSPGEAESNATLKHKIIVLCGPQEIEIDVFADTVAIRKSNDTLRLPVELENGMGFVHQKQSIVTVELKGGQFKLKCNLKYNVCVMELAGWYFGKTAGLLGTMNNEPWDDTLRSDGVVTDDILNFVDSWKLPGNQSQHSELKNLAVVGNADEESLNFCQNIFSNKTSEFGDCFAMVEPEPYVMACKNSRSMADACTLAISYMQICGFYDTYLRIPDSCTSCPMGDSAVPEGEIRKLEGSGVPSSTEVVFIVEAKECNRAVKQNRSITTLVSQLSKELMDNGLKNNRWALVTFGGDGVYDKPRSIILDNNIFTQDYEKFPDYFDAIKVGSGSQDVFGAIAFASQLVFRAGVSKTFILMPCSHCEPQHQSFEYSVVNQVLIEHETTLHILMDGDFQFNKQRLNKIFYGLDASKSYTRKDTKVLTGDVDLRRQVKLSKSALGYCTPLSLESNGTIFSGNKLRFDKSTAIKKFANVFAKRVAATARPNPCQHCECTADNDGVTHMDCMPCVYPMPTFVDYVSETFNEDDSLSSPQLMDADYAQLDDAED